MIGRIMDQDGVCELHIPVKSNPGFSLFGKEMDLSHKPIDSILSVRVNGLESKFHYNTITKKLNMFFDIAGGDDIIIRYYSVAECRDKKLNDLGI